MSTDVDLADGSAPHHGSTLLLLSMGGLCCLYGCSLKDFDYLKRGTPEGTGGEATHQGGAAGQATHFGGAAGIGLQGSEAGWTSVAGSADGGAAVGHGEGGIAGAGMAGNAGTDTTTGQGGTVQVTCDSGLTFCSTSGQCIDLDRGSPSGATVIHCGVCDTRCDATHATSVTCVDGKCVPTCSPGFADCNDTADNDGCETDLKAPTDCGACGRACSDFGAANVSCEEGLCAPTCLADFADCSRDDGSGTDDGCEVYLDDLKHCGTNCKDRIPCGSRQVCNAGVCSAPQGVVAFTVPFTEAGQDQRYADKFPTVIDLSNSTVMIRVYAPNVTSGQFYMYVSDQDYTAGASLTVLLNTLAEGWTDLAIPVGGIAGEFDPTLVYQLTMEIISASPGPWTDPAVIYIDSIRTLSNRFNHTFDASSSTIIGSTMMVVPGSTMTWLDTIPEPPEGAAGAGAGGAGS